MMMMMETIPREIRQLRACLLCSLVKTAEQFEYGGCDNCEAALQLKGRRDAVAECTSSSFAGVVAMMKPGESFVARRLRIDAPGVYAMSVSGRLPADVVAELKGRGVVYVSRDTAVTPDENNKSKN